MRKFLLLTTLTALCSLIIITSQAQTIEYEILENTPQSPVLSAGITLGDIFMHMSEDEVGSGGPGAYIIFRPISRLKLQGQVSTGFYGLMTNDTEEATGLRKVGGLYVEANGEYAWRRKGVNLVYEDGSQAERQFHLSSRVSGINQTTEKYINFPYNRTIERTVRGGLFSHTYPFSTVTGGYIGIGKYYTTFAKLKIGDEVLTDGVRVGYSLDYVLGTSTYVDGNRMGDPTGLRFGFEMESYRKRNTITRFEIGGMPGVEGMLMRISFKVGLFKTGSHAYKGDYKTQKVSDSKVVNLFRKL